MNFARRHSVLTVNLLQIITVFSLEEGEQWTLLQIRISNPGTFPNFRVPCHMTLDKVPLWSCALVSLLCNVGKVTFPCGRAVVHTNWYSASKVSDQKTKQKKCYITYSANVFCILAIKAGLDIKKSICITLGPCKASTTFQQVSPSYEMMEWAQIAVALNKAEHARTMPLSPLFPATTVSNLLFKKKQRISFRKLFLHISLISFIMF